MASAAELLRDFVNTLDVGRADDRLGAPGEPVGWLAEHGLVATGDVAGAAEMRTATALREGLRAALLRNHARAPQPLPSELEDVLAALPVRVSGTAGQPSLAPVDTGVLGGLERLAAAVVTTVADGTWARLKVCQEAACRAAFLDTSKNRSRAWCSMQLCGNRTKTRAYRARRRSDGS